MVVQLIQKLLRQALLAHNVPAAACRAAVCILKFGPDGFIIDVSNQLFRNRERAAANQIPPNRLSTAASRQNDVIIQPLGKLIDALQLTLCGKIYAAQIQP